jgi:hypothetical protein
MMSRLALIGLVAMAAFGSASARLHAIETDDFEVQGLELLQGRYGSAYPGYENNLPYGQQLRGANLNLGAGLGLNTRYGLNYGAQRVSIPLETEANMQANIEQFRMQQGVNQQVPLNRMQFGMGQGQLNQNDDMMEEAPQQWGQQQQLQGSNLNLGLNTRYGLNYGAQRAQLPLETEQNMQANIEQFRAQVPLNRMQFGMGQRGQFAQQNEDDDMMMEGQNQQFAQQPQLLSVGQQWQGNFGGINAAPLAGSKKGQTTVAAPIYTQNMIVPRIITQPILRTHMVTQPILQQQFIQQPIVETRQVIQPVIRRIITQPIIRPQIYDSTTIQPTLKTETIVQPHLIQQTIVTPQVQNEMSEAPTITEAAQTTVQQAVVNAPVSAKKSGAGLGGFGQY